MARNQHRIGRKKLGGESRFDKLVNSIRTAFKQATSKISYDFWEEMMQNDIARSSNPAKSAVQWYKQYRTDPNVWLKESLMIQGRLYLFDYKHPLGEKTLDFWDTNPLVLCLGHVKTQEGKLRSIGINLHLLPPKIRRLVMYTIFTNLKTSFKKDLYKDNGNKIQSVKWSVLSSMVEKYGAAFAYRMYAPSRMKNIVQFRTEDMPKAIWIPSARYAKTNPAQLEKLWKLYLKKNRAVARRVGGQSHNSAV